MGEALGRKGYQVISMEEAVGQKGISGHRYGGRIEGKKGIFRLGSCGQLWPWGGEGGWNVP